MSKRKTHGGKRAGAGRPALPEGERLKHRSMRLSDAHVAALERLAGPGETWRDVLRRLVEAATSVLLIASATALAWCVTG